MDDAVLAKAKRVGVAVGHFHQLAISIELKLSAIQRREDEFRRIEDWPQDTDVAPIFVKGDVIRVEGVNV